MEGAGDELRPEDERRNALRTYGQLLEAHVRYEERELFPMIEERFAPALLSQIGEALAEYEAGRDPACRMG
jgi:hemerythrin-like domain-containing protein